MHMTVDTDILRSDTEDHDIQRGFTGLDISTIAIGQSHLRSDPILAILHRTSALTLDLGVVYCSTTSCETLRLTYNNQTILVSKTPMKWFGFRFWDEV